MRELGDLYYICYSKNIVPFSSFSSLLYLATHPAWHSRVSVEIDTVTCRSERKSLPLPRFLGILWGLLIRANSRTAPSALF